MGGGLLPYIRDDIPTKLLKYDFGVNIGNLSRKRKLFFYEKKKTGFSMALTTRIKAKF